MKPQKVPVQCPKCGHTQQEPAAAYSTICKGCKQHFRIAEAEDSSRTAAKRKSSASPSQAIRQVTCLSCGHVQEEPEAAYSTVCKSCKQHFRIGEAEAPARPRAKTKASTPEPQAFRQVTCFNCGTVLDVPLAAQSTMCKRCSSHLDLRDYKIDSAVSRNFRTKGRFVIEQGGYLFNTDSIAGNVTLKGRLLGKLKAEGNFEIYSSAQIKGQFQAGNLVIPAGEHFRWPETIPVTMAEIAGELAANLHATNKVVLKATARFFGDIEGGGLVVEPGAVFVGNVRIRPGESTPAETPIIQPAVPLSTLRSNGPAKKSTAGKS